MGEHGSPGTAFDVDEVRRVCRVSMRGPSSSPGGPLYDTSAEVFRASETHAAVSWGPHRPDPI